MNGIITDYIDTAMSIAEYEKLDDGTYFGKVPGCSGAIAAAESLEKCKREMRSVFEDWILIGLAQKSQRVRHPLKCNCYMVHGPWEIYICKKSSDAPHIRPPYVFVDLKLESNRQPIIENPARQVDGRQVVV